MLYNGHCHCGALTAAFETDKPLAPRACQCRFCRRQHARMVSDPAGSLRLTLGGEVIRYRFGTATTDFLMCGRCGIYVAATAEIGGATYATVNLNCFDDHRPDLEAEPVRYDSEDAASRADRRRRGWTPARIEPA